MNFKKNKVNWARIWVLFQQKEITKSLTLNIGLYIGCQVGSIQFNTLQDCKRLTWDSVVLLVFSVFCILDYFTVGCS